MADSSIGHAPAFYTVREAAEIMRCNSSTLYCAIREDAFPAVKVPTPCTGRMACQSQQVHPTRRMLDADQDIDPFQRNRVDVQEIRRQDALGLRGE